VRRAAAGDHAAHLDLRERNGRNRGDEGVLLRHGQEVGAVLEPLRNVTIAE
jgi:hypothetical protein